MDSSPAAAELTAECVRLEAQVVEVRQRLQCEEARLQRRKRAAGGSQFMMGCGISFIVLTILGTLACGLGLIWFIGAVGAAIGSAGVTRC